MKDTDCIATLQWALPRAGLRWPGFRRVRRQVCRRLERRLAELGLPDATAYRRRLETDADELQRLAALCTVSVSRFFRDRTVFECLGARVVPALAAAALARRSQRLECWSAGCASGEEAYSLAIQWRAQLCASFPALGFRVLGTDVDATLLDRAQAACYQPSSLRELPLEWRELAFESREGRHCLRKLFRGGVEFECRDLRAEPPRRQFDLVLCRNLAFTYFGPDLARCALDRIASRLRPGGALVIGVHERLPPDAREFFAWPGCRAVFQHAVSA
ncbi:MAG: chemotaxis protein CheR [Betaproteobacteria bacterium]|nr:MAG: chemotaxis protein CheR [Betaproteobacteria bacterium]